MTRALIPLCLLTAIAPAHAWDPATRLNRAVQGQINRPMPRELAEAFNSVASARAELRSDNTEIRDARPGEVVIYTTPTCGYCRQALAYLKQRDIPDLNKDVSASREARAEWQALGSRGVPVALFGKHKVTGFAAASYDAAWERLQAEPQAATAPLSPAAGPMAAVPARAPALAAGEVLIARIARVKLLAEPQAQARVVGLLARQEEVIFLGQAQGGYLRIKSADAEGWAEDAFLVRP